MELATVDVLIEKASFDSSTALAVAEAMDIAIKGACLVTTSELDARLTASEAKMDARFAAFEVKMGERFAALEMKIETRFGSLEKSIEALRSWTTYLYAGLALAFFSALALDHHWLVTREDRLVETMQARTDHVLETLQARLDQRFPTPQDSPVAAKPRGD